MNPVCIVSAKRTPFGRFLGSLSRLSAIELACHAGESVLENVDRSKIDQVVVGNILSAGLGMNMARQIGIRLGLPVSATAFTVNMMCASGMQAIALAARSIESGEANAVLCGGSESMSNAPHLLPRSRTGIKLGDGKMLDSILQDGLIDTFDKTHMALTAETLANEGNISRGAQDHFAAESQRKYARSAAAGIFASEITPHSKLEHDEHPRPETSEASLSELSPAFNPEGSVTAGNASGINDGSAMLLLANRETVEENGWTALAEITATSAIGCDPARMGIGPVHAIRKLLGETETSLDEYDQIEINEAFAAQVLACTQELDLKPDSINPHGGAIALGHPIGASGARLIVHLAQQISEGKISNGLASLCVGGGMGFAISVQKPSEE